MTTAFLCVTIDCECDKGPRWRTELPLSFSGVRRGIAQELDPIFSHFRVKPTYLLSPEVIADERCVDVLHAARRRVELGTHLHGEYLGSAAPPRETRDFQRDYPPEVERAKLASITDLFVSAFGFRPRSFRAGRFGIGSSTLTLLEELGYAVDSSVTPFVDWASSGAPGLSFMGAPTQPYRPDRRDPALRGEAAITEVPLTIRPRFETRWARRWIESALPARWLRPTFASERALVSVARDEIDRARRDSPRTPPVLNLMFHNVEVVPGKSPYASSEGACRKILTRLAGFLEFARREGIRSIGLGDVAELLQ